MENIVIDLSFVAFSQYLLAIPIDIFPISVQFIDHY